MNAQFTAGVPMTAKDIATAVQVHTDTVRAWIRDGLLAPAFRVGNTACFTRDQVPIALALRDSTHGRRHDLYRPVGDHLALFEPIADAVERVRRADPAGKGVSLWTIRRWIEHDKMLGFRYGRHAIYLLRADVDELIARRAVTGPSPFKVPIGQARAPEHGDDPPGEEAA